MNLTTSEQLILGILAEQPRHGYEIEKVIVERGMRSWTDIGFSSIYYLLGKLEKEQLVKSQAIDAKSKGRKLYTITAKGINACTEAARKTLAESQTHEPLLVGLANSPLLENTELVELLDERSKQNKQAVEKIEQAQRSQGQLPAFVQAIFEYNIYKLKAEADWAEATVKKLKEETMEKVDFKKTLDSYRAKNHEFRIIDMPKMQYLMIDGHGDPNTAKEFQDAIEALYPVAYKLKFASKNELSKDYVVMPLEGLWWAEDMETFTSARDKAQWDFTLMIMQPGWITQAMFEAAVQKVAEKDPPANLGKVRLETLDEGKSVQTLHVGSFDSEANILAKMHHEFIPANNLKITGKHHEIYLSDFRKVAPEKLRTILRQPVR